MIIIRWNKSWKNLLLKLTTDNGHFGDYELRLRSRKLGKIMNSFRDGCFEDDLSDDFDISQVCSDPNDLFITCKVNLSSFNQIDLGYCTHAKLFVDGKFVGEDSDPPSGQSASFPPGGGFASQLLRIYFEEN